MEFAVAVTRVPDIKKVARRVEDLGYDYLATGEHVMFYGPVPNAFIRLAAAAGATERIKLLSAITLVPVYPPVLLAKLAASLDVESGGRFHLGVGVGGEYPPEFEAVGVPVSERGARTNEALQVVRKLLTGEKVSFQGRFTRFNDGQISPAPVQQPVPVWVAGRQEVAMKRVVNYGDVWLPYMYSPERLERSVKFIRDYAREQGRDPSEIKIAVYVYAAVYDDTQKARDMLTQIVGRNYQQDFSKMIDRYMLAGTPRQCADRLKDYRDAGAEKVVLQFGCPPEDVDQMLERVASEVIPEFR